MTRENSCTKESKDETSFIASEILDSQEKKTRHSSSILFWRLDSCTPCLRTCVKYLEVLVFNNDDDVYSCVSLIPNPVVSCFSHHLSVMLLFLSVVFPCFVPYDQFCLSNHETMVNTTTKTAITQFSCLVSFFFSPIAQWQTLTNVKTTHVEKEPFAWINQEDMSVLVQLDSLETPLPNKDVLTSTNVRVALIWKENFSVGSDPIVSILLDLSSVSVLQDTPEIPKSDAKVSAILNLNLFWDSDHSQNR